MEHLHEETHTCMSSPYVSSAYVVLPNKHGRILRGISRLKMKTRGGQRPRVPPMILIYAPAV